MSGDPGNPAAFKVCMAGQYVWAMFIDQIYPGNDSDPYNHTVDRLMSIARQLELVKVIELFEPFLNAYEHMRGGQP